jgi:hypothetical protein
MTTITPISSRCTLDLHKASSFCSKQLFVGTKPGRGCGLWLTQGLNERNVVVLRRGLIVTPLLGVKLCEATHIHKHERYCWGSLNNRGFRASSHSEDILARET